MKISERRAVVVLERRFVLEHGDEIVDPVPDLLMVGDSTLISGAGKVLAKEGLSYSFVRSRVSVKDIYLEPPIWIQNLKRWLHL